LDNTRFFSRKFQCDDVLNDETWSRAKGKMTVIRFGKFVGVDVASYRNTYIQITTAYLLLKNKRIVH